MTEEKQPEEMNVKAEAQVQETKAQPDEDVVLQQGEEVVKADASSQEQNAGQEEAQAKEEDPQVTIAALKSQLEVLAKQALSDKEKMLRVVAEADNSRKRAEADVERERKYALEKFVKALIPVVDSLDMALEAGKSKSENAQDAMVQGVEATLRLFLKELSTFGVERIDPVGEPFDPNVHQAISMIPSKDVKPNCIVSVMQKGFILNGRVVRPAMVMVARAAE
ncbi:nucleotide exchange factor GrpE [uncultured Succinatimonas sp.]|uniref:nucleotide exchange factor GrpE n=1 Tax=uncultured Succinatimonas sp. TaxID=1262973 RepID=UPI0025E9B5D7|nr:nucleotide exchange factor GrpE [uncultured Succinatimonas sp.]